MGSIIVLDENTSNKIAAGEVVDKPASVVKELVENSIDAGADSISVDIKNGGISYIKVTDNGKGMAEDDVIIAFERHATSKIRRAEDLDSIITMGFRGEALASIAAVSNVELQTKTKDSTYGMYVNISGGNVNEVRQTGCHDGTTFTIRDLFFNTPARYKFLKKDSTEAGYISDNILRIALGNPDISFKLTSNHATLLHTPGNGDLKSAIFSIYGREVVRDLIEVSFQDEKMKIYGYVGKPEAAKANRNYQSLYINKRYVKSKLVSYTVDQAFNGVLMKNKFPFYVLNIDINPLLVDANVHPQKMEVRFADESYLSRSVYMAVSNALNSSTLFNPVTLAVKDRELFKFEQKQPKAEYVQETININVSPQKKETMVQSAALINRPLKPADNPISINSSANISYEGKSAEAKVSSELHSKLSNLSKPLLTEAPVIMERQPVPSSVENTNQPQTVQQKDAAFTQTSDQLQPLQKKDEALTGNCNQLQTVVQTDEASVQTGNPSQAVQQKEAALTEMKYIGQAFSTYIILQSGDELVLIDQHAAHERIIYERIREKYEISENLSQLLLEPIVLQLSPIEVTAVKENTELLTRVGFVFEDFGNNSIILRGIPNSASHSSAGEMFIDLADKIQHSVKPINTPIADEVIHTIACKAAIKANKKLNDAEVYELLSELSITGRRFTCPHGRPTIIHLKKSEIEKMFKRIV